MKQRRGLGAERTTSLEDLQRPHQERKQRFLGCKETQRQCTRGTDQRKGSQWTLVASGPGFHVENMDGPWCSIRPLLSRTEGPVHPSFLLSSEPGALPELLTSSFHMEKLEYILFSDCWRNSALSCDQQVNCCPHGGWQDQDVSRSLSPLENSSNPLDHTCDPSSKFPGLSFLKTLVYPSFIWLRSSPERYLDGL